MEAGSSMGFLFLISLESITGIVTNVFIIVRICLFYRRNQAVSGSEKIIAALSVSNLCYTCLTFADIIAFNIWPFLVLTTIFPAVFVTTMFTIITSSWLTASLSFYYYIKIKNVSSNLLSRLKQKINSLVSWMILASILLALLCSLLITLQIIMQQKLSGDVSMCSNTSRTYSSHGIFDTNLYTSFISSLLPFLISVTTTASNAWSLHLHKLKLVRNQLSSTNVRKYEGVIKVMICLLIFYALIYVAAFLFYFNIFATFSLSFWVFPVILCSYSPTHSIFLSLSNTKLKKDWIKMFACKSKNDKEDREE